MSVITTYLEMRSPEQLRPKRCADPEFRIEERKERDWRFNRDCYFAVGETWAWRDKRGWTDEQWKDYGLAPELRSFAAYDGNSFAGYYELHYEDGAVEIAYFGLLPEFISRGFGGALLTSAIGEAWRSWPAVSRVWVHTCTLDHPQALANYQARGMVIYEIEES